MIGLGQRTGCSAVAPLPHARGVVQLCNHTSTARSADEVSDTGRDPPYGLLNACFQSAFIAARTSPISQAFYDRKRREGESHKQALIALARRRINVIWAILRDNTTYDDTSISPTRSRPFLFVKNDIQCRVRTALPWVLSPAPRSPRRRALLPAASRTHGRSGADARIRGAAAWSCSSTRPWGPQ